MLAKGATGAMLDSKTFKMAKEVIAEGAVDGIAEAAAIAQQADEAATNAQRAIVSIRDATSEAYSILRSVNAANDLLEEKASKVTVTDKKTLEAINAYTTVLARTKDVVGAEGMTEGVWQRAIEAASYCAWRTASKQQTQQQRGSW